MFTLITPDDAIDSFPDLSLEPVKVEFQTAKFDLFLSMTSHPEGLSAHLEYNTDLFDAATAERMLQHFSILLESIM